MSQTPANAAAPPPTLPTPLPQKLLSTLDNHPTPDDDALLPRSNRCLSPPPASAISMEGDASRVTVLESDLCVS
jgi:hypothetical protein